MTARMTSKHRKVVLMGALALGAVGLASWQFLASSQHQTLSSSAGAEANLATTAGAGSVAAPVSVSVAGTTANSAPPQEVSTAGSAAAPSPDPTQPNSLATGESPLLEAKFAQKLGEYTDLQKQVLLTPEQSEAKNRLLQDEELILAMKTLFSTKLGSSEQENLQTLANQNAAIDLLLEARQAVNSEAAQTVLQAIIEDARLEQSDYDFRDRTVWAEIKAEVMYRWTAQEPDKASAMNKWAPGPVSQKIWQNVTMAQNQNRLESK